jgi:magnesium-protoporphyrin O-methyltransferase
VTQCCAPSGYDELFSERQARRDARRYRRRGLDPAARWIVDVVRSQGVEGATVLEPGGGVGAIQLDLLKMGALRSVVVELSPGYDQSAAALAREVGLEQRIERRIADFSSDSVEAADVVVMHRVVCCYPDYDRLLGAAADHARRLLVFTHPPRNLPWRAGIALANLWVRLHRQGFRAFVHPPSALEEAVRRRGFETIARRNRGIWRGFAFVRRSAGSGVSLTG